MVKKFPQSCPDKTAIYTVFLAAMQPQANTVLGTDSRGLSPAFRYASYIHTRTYRMLLRRDRETDREISSYTYHTRICPTRKLARGCEYAYTRIRTCTYIHIYTYIFIYIHIDILYYPHYREVFLQHCDRQTARYTNVDSYMMHLRVYIFILCKAYD